MEKLVISSFYNCLIDKEDAIPLSTMLEIEKIRNKGNLFVINTNSSYNEVLYYNKDFPFLDYIISLNGSYIYDVKKSSCLYKKKISKKTINKIINIFKNNEIYFLTKDKSLTIKELNTEDEIYKIEIILNKKIDLSTLNEIEVTSSINKKDNKIILEIVSNLTNNFIATTKLLKSEKISLENVIVIAANEADLELVKNIPKSYLVSNCSKNLKEFSDKKTKSNNSKGVENVLKRIS